MGRILFITGTDTGVGKTAVTALLLAHAQSRGLNVRALKPFSSGGVGDEALLGALQGGDDRINFYHYAEPIAPWTAARLRDARVSLEDLLAHIQPYRLASDLLLVEGAGGLLTPLADQLTAVDIITALEAEVLIVAANRIGVLNHTLLTVEVLRQHGIKKMEIALVEQSGADVSRKTNLSDLRVLLPSIPVVPIPYLSNFLPDERFIRGAADNLHEPLVALLSFK